MNNLLTINQFIQELCHYWDMRPEDIDIHRPLIDSGIDSLGLLELIIMLEDFGGNDLPEELWSEETTLLDIFTTYELYASRDRRDDS